MKGKSKREDVDHEEGESHILGQVISGRDQGVLKTYCKASGSHTACGRQKKG